MEVVSTLNGKYKPTNITVGYHLVDIPDLLITRLLDGWKTLSSSKRLPIFHKVYGYPKRSSAGSLRSPLWIDNAIDSTQLGYAW